MAPLLLSVILGALMGLERSIAGKQAGMRTYALVSLGSCLFTLVGVVASYQLSMFAGINPLQIAGSVVIGIGFIGAGLAAIRGSEHAELTTAAGIWVASAVGLACGLGMYAVATATAVLSVLVFKVFLSIENSIRRRYGGEN
ncbi:MAG: MgtC/SapB family protein [Patescibacteria group bacterium]